jgi:hypothetical protein
VGRSLELWVLKSEKDTGAHPEVHNKTSTMEKGTSNGENTDLKGGAEVEKE